MTSNSGLLVNLLNLQQQTHENCTNSPMQKHYGLTYVGTYGDAKEAYVKRGWSGGTLMYGNLHIDMLKICSTCVDAKLLSPKHTAAPLPSLQPPTGDALHFGSGVFRWVVSPIEPLIIPCLIGCGMGVVWNCTTSTMAYWEEKWLNSIA